MPSPITLRRTVLSGSGVFDSYSLFGKYSAEGLLHDRLNPALRISGLALQYEEDSGETIVDATSDPVGLALDRSQGVVTGPELVTNGTFNTDISGWSNTGAGGSISWTSGQMTVTGEVASFAIGSQSVTTVVGQWYLVTIDINTVTATDFCGLRKADDSGMGSNVVNLATGSPVSTGSYSSFFQATATTTWLGVQCNGVGTVVVDNVSAKKISGNHGSQSSASKRLTLQQVSSRWLWRGDGVDDHLLTALNPATSMTLIEVGTPDSGSENDVLMGSQPASDGRAYLSLDGSGFLAGGVGTQSASTIVDSTSTDIRSVRCGKAIRWNGSTVDLFLNTGSGLVNVYSAAQNGAANTTIAMMLMALNDNGSEVAAANSDSELFFAITAAMSESDIATVINSIL